MKKIYLALACLSAFAFSSCDDYLDVHPKGEKVEDDLFDKASGFEDAIYGVYGSLKANSLYGRDLHWGVVDVLSQDMTCSSTSFGNAIARYEYTGNSSVEERFLGIWKTAYKSIGYANNVLKNLEKKSPDAFHLYNMYKGEMLGVRAMVHFDLLRLFAPTNQASRGIPYVTSYSFSVKPFLTVGECYKAIIADLTEAEALLAEDEKIISYPRDNNQYDNFCNWRETHMNLYAVRALLARVYWTIGDMANAARYAENVINSKAFPLVDQSEVQNYLAGALSPKETILGLYSNTYFDVSQNDLYTYTNTRETWCPYDNVLGSAYLMPWHDLFNLDIDGTQQDFRKTHFRQADRTVKFLKVLDYREIEGLEKPSDLITGTTLIHTSELYLIAADALLETNYTRALELFNAEITSRGLNELRDDQPLTAERIYNEYHKELFGEGQQWFNMKRLKRDIVSNKEARVIPASDAVYVLPIPQQEFDYRD